MKIALVCPYDLSQPGGVQAQVFGLVDRLGALGERAWAVGPGFSQPDRPHHSIGSAVGVPANGSIARLALAPSTGRRLRAAVEDADVIHVHEPFIPLASWAALRVPRPQVVTFHADPPAMIRRLYRGGARIVHRLLQDKIVTAVSPTAARPIHSLGKSIDVVPNAVELPSEVGDLADREPQVVFVGRDEPRKGLAVLLDAWRLVRPQVPEARLVVIGPERLPADADGVQTLGRCSDDEKWRVLARSKVFAAPNLGGESFGITLVEAMAHGCAVVASDLPAFRDVASDAAEYVRPGDPAQLATALVRLLEDDRQRLALAREGVERSQQFSWAKVVHIYRRLYDNAIRL